MRFSPGPLGVVTISALLLAVAVGTGTAQATQTVLGGQTLARHADLQRLGAHRRLIAPLVSSRRARPFIGAGQQYTISDVGAPPNTVANAETGLPLV